MTSSAQLCPHTPTYQICAATPAYGGKTQQDRHNLILWCGLIDALDLWIGDDRQKLSGLTKLSLFNEPIDRCELLVARSSDDPELRELARRCDLEQTAL